MHGREACLASSILGDQTRGLDATRRTCADNCIYERTVTCLSGPEGFRELLEHTYYVDRFL